MSSSEGRHEIEAARGRLAAAKAQASAAAKNVELAKATLVHAESLLTSSNKEVGDAEKGLKEAEERWEVIDVDAAEVTADNGGQSRKKRKVSLSPAAARDGASNSESARPSSSLGAAARASRNNGAANEFSDDDVPLSEMARASRASATAPPSNHIGANNARAAASAQPNQTQGGTITLSRGAKEALRQAVLSAIRHPQGEVDPELLRRAMNEGLPRQAVLNAAIVGRVRHRRNTERSERQQQQRHETPAPGSVLSKKHTDALFARIKKMISDIAEAEQRKGSNVFYWNIMNGSQMEAVAKKVPRTVIELTECDIPVNIRMQYGQRIVKTVNDYIAEEDLHQYVLEANSIRMVMSQASCSRTRAAAALERFNGDMVKAIMSLAT